ncbi:MAG: putative Holliday junction resolvase [Acidimicrobiales bacterium]|nr:putative Holliday junction resolvase [Acidimicrobiales bacterium]
MRVVGLDLGSRRVGVAVSDAGGTLASPHTVIVRSGDDGRDRLAIRAVVDEYEAERVVVGLPLSLDGTDGPAARAARAEAEALGAVLPVPVELWDERLTTVSADRDLMALRMKADARRRVVDKVAAAVMLQSWLDARG